MHRPVSGCLTYETNLVVCVRPFPGLTLTLGAMKHVLFRLLLPGSVDFPALFSALAAADYKGPITFESFSSRVVNPQLSNTLCIWRNL
jgi:sugar phosphate isomerase/epimerase